jgi:hypothetical protein
MDKETIRIRVRELDLKMASEEEVDTLVGVVQGNESTFLALDRMELKPEHGPFAFGQVFEARRKRGDG